MKKKENLKSRNKRNIKKNKKKKSEKKYFYTWIFLLISFVLILLLFIPKSFSGFSFFGEVSQEGLTDNLKRPIGMEEDFYGYDSVSKIMTDNNGLTYKTEVNGVITINDERYLAFALKGTVGGSEYIYTSMDFGWTWHINQTGNDYIFWAENDNPNFIWRQYYYFYEDPFKPMKIKHYLQNDLADITDAQMYYLTNVLLDDTIKYNSTEYLVSENMGFHRQGNFNSLIKKINFNSDYAFSVSDLVENNFTINEFYIGEGSVIDRPNINITAIGFTKNNGNFPRGTSVWIDPTFTTSDVEALFVIPLKEDMIVVGWGEEITLDVTHAVYYTNGTKFGNDIDSSVYTRYWLSASEAISGVAFNDTHFVVNWYSHQNASTLFRVWDIYGNDLTGQVIAEDNIGFDNTATTSVTALNSTHFVIAYPVDASDDISFDIWDIYGNEIIDEQDADTSFGTGDTSTISVSAFNETAFVIGWYDNATNDADFNVFSFNGTAATEITGIVAADTFIGYDSDSVHVATFNDTHFVIAWFDDFDEDASFRIYDSEGNPNTDIIDAHTAVGGLSKSVQVETINETHFVISWFMYTGYDFMYSVYDANGNNNTIVTIEDTLSSPHPTVPIASHEAATGIEICNDNFIVAYAPTDSSALWQGYYPNGTIWNGECGDISISINSPLNVTYNTSSIIFNVSVTSLDYSISSCQYSLDSASNVSLSNSAGNFWTDSGSLNYGSHNVIFYCNNTQGNWSNTNINYFFVDGGNESCTNWYNYAWDFRKNIIIDKDMVNGTQTNFPLLVNITDMSLELYAQNDGDDILFTDVGGCNKLDHEIEYWNKTTGRLVAWVKVPVLSASSDTIIKMYYNNSLAGNQENIEGVWDSNFELVQHLEESSGVIYDSTSNNHNGVNNGATFVPEYLIDGAYDFGNGDNITFNSPITLTTGTYSFWITPDNLGTLNNIILSRSAVGWSRSKIFIASNNYLVIETDTDDQQTTSFFGNYFSNDILYYVTVARNGDYFHLYVNGEFIETKTINGADSLTSNALSSTDYYYHGGIDEVRISNINRSADWINTTYMNQINTSAFYQVGGDEPPLGVSIVYPLNKSYEIGEVTSLNYTYFNVEYCWYSVNDGSANSSAVSAGTNFTGLSSVNGSNKWIVWCNDSDNALVSDSVVFDVNDIPQIIWEDPTPDNGNSIRDNFTYLNTTIIDEDETSAWFDWNYSLVGYWSFDFYNSTGVFDNSSYDKFGRFNGGLGTSDLVNGSRGNGLDFDGVDDSVNVGENFNFSGTNHFTISSWINTNGYKTSSILSRYNTSVGGAREVSFYMLDSNITLLRECGTFNLKTNYVPPLNEWVNVVFRFDGSYMAFYVNGEFYQQELLDCSVPPVSSADVLIGSLQTGADYTYSFNGSIDEVMVFNRNLSLGEIQSLYQNSIYRLENNFTNLVEGDYNYSAYVIDTEGNLVTDERGIAIDYDYSICETLSTPNEIYILQNNVSSTGTCFTISAENITLDCNNYWINYSTGGADSTYGIFSNQYNTTIKNCNVVDGNLSSLNSNRHGIYFFGATYGNLSNNGVDISGTSSHGLYIRSSSNYNNIMSNNIISDLGIGIYLQTSSYNNLTSNTVNSTSNVGIYLQTSSYNNLTSNIVVSSSSYGIFVYSTSDYNNLTSNNGTSNSNVGIGIQSSNYNILTSNIGSSDISYGIHLNGGSNNTLTSNKGISASSYGIYLQGSTYNTLKSNTGKSTSNYGIYVRSSSNYNIFNLTNATGVFGFVISASMSNKFFDCFSVQGSSSDVYVNANAGSTNNTFLNCSYDTELVSGDGNNLIRKWYFDANVSYSNWTAIEDANVTIYNLTNSTISTQLTDSNGDISRIELIEYINTEGTKAFSTPHFVIASKFGYYDNFTTYNLSVLNNVFAIIFLEEISSSCVYQGFGAWDIDCLDNCTLTENVVGDGSYLNISGNGHTVINANITGFLYKHIDGGSGHCRVTCLSGGCIK